MKKRINPKLQESRDMIDAMREFLGKQPLYSEDKVRPHYAAGYMNGIGDGNSMSTHTK